MNQEKRRALKKLVRSVLPANPSSKVVETFFGEVIAQNLPMANSVRELAEWIVDRLLEDLEQLRTTLNRLDDGSPQVTELLSWVETLPPEGIFSESELEGPSERPQTSDQRLERWLRIVETGSSVIGGVGPTAAILYIFRDGADEAAPTTKTNGEQAPKIDISPREEAPLKVPEPTTSDSESMVPKSMGSYVQLEFQTSDGEQLVNQKLLVKPDQLEQIENWLAETDPQDPTRELVFEGYVARGGGPAPISTELDTSLESVSIRYQGPNLTLSKELPVLVAARAKQEHVEQPTDDGIQVAAFDVQNVPFFAGLLALALLGAWVSKKASRRLFKAFFGSG